MSKVLCISSAYLYACAKPPLVLWCIAMHLIVQFRRHSPSYLLRRHINWQAADIRELFAAFVPFQRYQPS